MPVYNAPGHIGAEMLQGTFTISRYSNNIDYDVPLTVMTVYSGTAHQNFDYQVSLTGPNDGSKPVIPANQMSTSVTITVLPQRYRTGWTEIDLEAMSNDSHLGPDGNNDPVTHDGTGSMAIAPTSLVTVAASTPEATEGDPSPAALTISRTGDDTYPLVVSTSIGGTAIAGTDYQTLGNQVTIPAGKGSVAVPVVPTGEPSDQGDVSVSLSILPGTFGYEAGNGASDSNGLFQNWNASVTIHDGIPVVSITAPQPSASEQGQIPGEFEVNRSGDISGPMTVSYTVGGTAVPGYDYNTLPGSVIIPAGSSFALIPINPIDHSTPGGGPVSVSIELLITSASTAGPTTSANVNISTSASGSPSQSSRPTIHVPVYYTTQYHYVQAGEPDQLGPLEYFPYIDFGSSDQDYADYGNEDPFVELAFIGPTHGTAQQFTEQSHENMFANGSLVRYWTIYGYDFTPNQTYPQGMDYVEYLLSRDGQTGDAGLAYAYYDSRPPTLDTPGDQNDIEGYTPDLSFNAADPDDNELFYSATNLPPGLSIDPLYGNITGSIDYGDAFGGPYHVTVSVTNNRLSASQSFLWNVTPAAPSIDNADDDSWDDMNNAEGDMVSAPVIASDNDGLPLSYSATGLPAGLSIDPMSGIISGVIDQGDDTGSSYDVVVSVSNGYRATTLEFPWLIDRVDLPAPAEQTNTAGDSVNLTLGAIDLNGLLLTYTADGLPDGLTIDPNTGVISGTADPSGASRLPWQVTVDATDGNETTERTFNWTILPSVIPSLSLANPGDQVNLTTDVISLPIQGQASAPDDLTFSATGLPNGLSIDEETGVISGMDDDFDAADGTTYVVTVSESDDYGQSTSQVFQWQFNAPSTGSSGSGGGGTNPPGNGPGGPGQFSGQGPSNGAPGPGAPSSHPTTEARDDNFSISAFWQNVEKFPGGIAAENWLLSQNGQVQWAWLGITTDGQFERGGGPPIVYIPQRFNEADAASSFVYNVNKDYLFGFAAYSRVPTNGNPDDWQEYIKERTQAGNQVAVAGAELYLSGLSVVNEGADWVVTIDEIANAKTPGQVALASIAFLPFITGSSLKVVSKGLQIVNASTFQQALIGDFIKLYKKNGFSPRVFDNLVVFKNSLVMQRSDIIFDKSQVRSMMDGHTPYAFNPSIGKSEQVVLHHVDQYPQDGGVIAEVFSSENAGTALHPNGPNGVKHDPVWDAFRSAYWHDRLQMGINNGWVNQGIINQYRSLLLAKGFTLP